MAKYKNLCKNQIGRKTVGAPCIPKSDTAITSVRGRVARESDAITSTYNFPIQATCADILKTAVRLFTLLKKQHVIDDRVFIVLTAHDEVVLKCPVGIVENTKTQVNAVLLAAAHSVLQPIQPKIQWEVEIGVGNSWADKP